MEWFRELLFLGIHFALIDGRLRRCVAFFEVFVLVLPHTLEEKAGCKMQGGLAALSIAKFCLQLLIQATNTTNHAYTTLSTHKYAETAPPEGVGSNRMLTGVRIQI